MVYTPWSNKKGRLMKRTLVLLGLVAVVCTMASGCALVATPHGTRVEVLAPPVVAVAPAPPPPAYVVPAPLPPGPSLPPPRRW
jgi:hypothetical protein